MILVCFCLSLSSSAPFIRHDFAMLYPMDPYIQYNYFDINFSKIFQKAANSVKNAYSYVNNWIFDKFKGFRKGLRSEIIKPQINVKAYKVYRDVNGNLLVEKLPKIGELNNKHSDNYDPSLIEPLFLDDNNLNEEVQQINIAQKKSSQKKDLFAKRPYLILDGGASDSKITKNPFRWNEKMENDKFFSKSFKKYVIHPIILIKHPKNEDIKEELTQSPSTLSEKQSEIFIGSKSTSMGTKTPSNEELTQTSQSSSHSLNDVEVQTEKAQDNSQQTSFATQSENSELHTQPEKSFDSDVDHLKQKSTDQGLYNEQKQHKSEMSDSSRDSFVPKSSQAIEHDESSTSKTSTYEPTVQSNSPNDSFDDNKSQVIHEKSDNKEEKSSAESKNEAQISSDEGSPNSKEKNENVDNTEANPEKSTLNQASSEKTMDDKQHNVDESSSNPSEIFKDPITEINANVDGNQQLFIDNPSDEIINKVLSIVQPS